MEAISIIIPTLNEQDYLGSLLSSLKKQTYKQFEVIVSDGNSSDKTISVAKSYAKSLTRLTIVLSKKRSPAHQRNIGVAKAGYKRLLFLDADTILPADFLEKALQEIGKRNLDIAQTLCYPISQKQFDKILFQFTNWSCTFMSKFYPVAAGWALFSTKSLHDRLGGFDEKLNIIAEDLDYTKRAVSSGFKFGTLSVPMFISVRRLDLEGRIGTLKNLVLNSIYFAVFGKREAQKYIQREYGKYSS